MVRPPVAMETQPGGDASAWSQGNRGIIMASSMLDEIFKFIQSTRQPSATTATPKPLNRITQCQIQRPLENLQGWQLHHLGNQFQCLITRTVKQKFSDI